MFTLAKVDWQPILEGRHGPPLLVIIASCLCVVAVVGMIQWRRVRIAEAEAALKMRMVERDYSPEQIAQVLETKMDKSRRGRCRETDFLTAPST